MNRLLTVALIGGAGFALGMRAMRKSAEEGAMARHRSEVEMLDTPSGRRHLQHLLRPE